MGQGDTRRLGGGGGGGAGEDRTANSDASQNNDASTSNEASTLQFLYTNAQSLVNKIDEMRVIVAITNPDILIITETWTNESVSNEYLSISGYDVIERKDRNDTANGRGGGILVYAKKSLYA